MLTANGSTEHKCLFEIGIFVPAIPEDAIITRQLLVCVCQKIITERSSPDSEDGLPGMGRMPLIFFMNKFEEAEAQEEYEDFELETEDQEQQSKIKRAYGTLRDKATQSNQLDYKLYSMTKKGKIIFFISVIAAMAIVFGACLYSTSIA